MSHPTPAVAAPAGGPFQGAIPDARTLQELGALYPAIALADMADSATPCETAVESGLDEEVMNEAIFAGMVALR
jgi:hypothetical protein